MYMYMHMYMYVGIDRFLEERHIINCISYHRIINATYKGRSYIIHVHIHVHVYFGESTPDEHACTCTLYMYMYMYIAEYIHVHCTIQITAYYLLHIVSIYYSCNSFM